MSILIKGMDVPHNCSRRDALNRAYVQGRVDEAERWSRREAEEEET